MTERTRGRATGATRAWLLVAAYAGVVSVLSHMSRPPVPRPLQVALGSFGLHVVEFAIFASLLYLAIARTRPRWSLVALVLTTIAGTAAFGAIDEFHQSFIPGRYCQATDVLADTLGGILASVLLVIRRRRGG